MRIAKIAAFSHNRTGGNPAGVVLLDTPLTDQEMARIAADLGYSETAFAVAQDGSTLAWRVRYFSPQSEVPFCGHATIALGAALGEQYGKGQYDLTLNDAAISVHAQHTDGGYTATLTSPPTHSRPLTADERAEAMSLFELSEIDFDPRLAPARIHGGSDHIVLPLRNRERLSQMHYRLADGKAIMDRHGLVTIMLVTIEDNHTFDVRNAFASGGVFEDPATGAAAAAFAGYLRDVNWEHGGHITLHQGHDMGHPSLIKVQLSDEKGSPVSVSGATRSITDD
ncbi:PhzF family phenazine biosynthesis protein [Aestuariibacter halophilus]|uniref:PhzF family phenazine biosynthesis protein n=1 Tax=Fluctibacter halophilus TaxID=226011 RepID=A0ABS8GB44_9ALTE|nr:PhzF family phenazine biosynthesis protein [Aestuariibacter halophilus]MCC2617757.1 PhzF family phenazine biosynthesis protein [Aestuariibacter halophilus]